MIRVNTPQEDNNNITVVSPNNTISVNTKNSIMFSEDLSQQWATKMDGKVKNEDFSSKYYAKMSAESAEIAETNANISVSKNNELTSNFESYNSHIIATATNAENNITQTAETAQNEISTIKQTAKEEINNSAESAKQEITTTKDDVVQAISTTKNSAVTEISQEGQKQLQNIESTGFYMRDGKLYFINSKGEEEEFKSGGGGLPLGYIGQTTIPIDESLGFQRYANGSQMAINKNTESFVALIEKWAKLYPNMVTSTQEEWETIKTLSHFGQCGKYFINREQGYIQLPLVVNAQGLTDLSNFSNIVEAGLPNIEGSLYFMRSFGDASSNGEGALYYTQNTGSLYGLNYDSAIGKFDGTITLDASHSNPIYGNSNTVQPESVRYPYFIQVATGAETEANITNELELNNPFFFGMSQYFEVEPNNLSWLRSAGQYNSKAVYPAYYDWLLREYNNPTTPNVDVMGTPTFNNGVYSNFATANYVRIPETFTNTSKPWEFVIPLKLSSFGTTAQYIFCSESYGFGLNVGTDGKLQTYISGNGTSWNINSGRVSSLTISLNTQYYIKTAWTGTQYVVSVSTDKKSYTTYITVDSTSPIASSLFKFGTGRATAGQSLLTAEIDIKEAELISNGSVWWKGLSAKNIKMSTEAYTDYDWVINSADETFRLPLLDGSEDLPSDGYIKIDFPASSAKITAPKNGFYMFLKQPTSAGQYLHVENVTNGVVYEVRAGSNGGSVGASIFAKRGDIIDVYYSLAGTLEEARFSQAQGNGSLYYYVGETVQNANLINAGRLEEKLVNIQNEKLDRSSVKAYITETYKNGTSWYRVYSDGWCVQGGACILGTFSYTFLKKYKNRPNVQLTRMSNTDTALHCIDLSFNAIPTTSGFTLNQNFISNFFLGADWIACGYIV